MKQKKLFKIITILFFIMVFYLLFYWLNNSNIKIKNEDHIKLLLNKTNFKANNKNFNQFNYIINKIKRQPETYLIINNYKFKKETLKPPKKELIKESITKPIIYLYNSHQTESYAPSTFLEETINPTVMIIDYILKDEFKKENYESIIEVKSIKEILNRNKWRYSYSYKASRILMEETKKNNPSLKYFIDIHRDSLKKERTTIEIKGKKYAKILFIVGLENPNYQQNLTFTTEINNLINQKYPNLSKGIYKKGGRGVNGVYNQDFSPFTILIEMGGYENTTTEVLNSSLAFAECFLEILNKYEKK